MTPTLAELVVSPVQRVVVACHLYQNGVVVASPVVTGGSVTADSRRAILRDCSLELAAGALDLEEIWELLITPGVTIGLSRGFRLPDGSEVLAGLGRFVPDAPELKRTAAGESLSVSGTDVAIKVQRARWTDPYQILAGTSLAEALTDLLADRYPPITTAITSDICPETMGTGLVTEAGDSSDPWTDAVNLAEAFGYLLYADTGGIVTVRRVSAPVADSNAFIFARGSTSTITETSLASPLDRTYNGVIASGEGTGTDVPVRGEAWDDNPSSPSYRGGPFGLVPYFYSSPLLTTVDQCESAATKILAGHIGRVEQLSWRSVVHPGLQPLDVVGIEQADGSLSSFVIDSLTIPLDVGGTMSAVAREVRKVY